jgi:hypothetical protein
MPQMGAHVAGYNPQQRTSVLQFSLKIVNPYNYMHSVVTIQHNALQVMRLEGAWFDLYL